MVGGSVSGWVVMASGRASEPLCTVLDEFLELDGDYGNGAGDGVGGAWVDARVSRIAGGASEVLRDIISRNLGTGAA